jgi:hypothetical protein
LIKSKKIKYNQLKRSDILEKFTIECFLRLNIK